ncbi:MAG: glycoside hydrolase family 15 protein [Cryobacterium sp.]|nr:glycoside hydrolase family 15 protein [Cryobacterium sp.]MCY7403502.1 glycoside hydrolase family 15 protein [Cryobacterium sp.]
MSDLPIADHALLSDRHSAALVTREGSIVWPCFSPVRQRIRVCVNPGRRYRALVDPAHRARPEYGLVVPVLDEIDHGVVATGGSGRLTLSLPAPVMGLGKEIRVQFTLEAGQHRYFALQRTRFSEPMPGAYSQDEIAAGLAATTASWPEWSAIHQSYDGPWRELVHHSGRLLQALRYQPTGAIVPAATTSLPEEIGGERNWDQPQLDVYGELLDAAFRRRGQLGEIEPATRTFLVALADAAASQRLQPDNGIWEVRGAPRHFVYSKLMCWPPRTPSSSDSRTLEGWSTGTNLTPVSTALTVTRAPFCPAHSGSPRCSPPESGPARPARCSRGQ